MRLESGMVGVGETKDMPKCPSCGVEMQLAREVKFRIGGVPGEWLLLTGDLGEIGEQLLPFNLYVCPKCGRIELFADEKTKTFLLRLTPKAYLKKCVKCGKEIPLASEECQYCGTKQSGYVEP